MARSIARGSDRWASNDTVPSHNNHSQASPIALSLSQPLPIIIHTQTACHKPPVRGSLSFTKHCCSCRAGTCRSCMCSKKGSVCTSCIPGVSGMCSNTQRQQTANSNTNKDSTLLDDIISNNHHCTRHNQSFGERFFGNFTSVGGV